MGRGAGRPRTRSAHFSPTSTNAGIGIAADDARKIEASATLRPAMPWTRNSGRRPRVVGAHAAAAHRMMHGIGGLAHVFGKRRVIERRGARLHLDARITGEGGRRDDPSRKTQARERRYEVGGIAEEIRVDHGGRRDRDLRA